MSRQANFSELREAIRQGQMKISQGLQTGQMRSDRNKADVAPKPRLDPAHEMLGKKPVIPEKPAIAEENPVQVEKPVLLGKAPTLTERSALFEKRAEAKTRFTLPKMPQLPKLPKIRISLPSIPSIPVPGVRSMLYGVVTVLGVALVVLMIFGIGKALMRPAQAPTPTPAATVTDEPPIAVQRPAEPRPAVPQTAVEPPKRVEAPRPVVVAPVRQTGNNVIVIQYISSSRENELRPVQEFFNRNGIATELMRRGGGSYLVTRDRFENPNRSGSDGYEMKKKIKTLGKKYPAQTGDTKFGAEPFQDAYGMLKQ